MNEEQEEPVDRRDPFNFNKCSSCAFRTKSLRVMRSHFKKHEVESSAFSCQIGTLEVFECQFCYFGHNLKIVVDRHESLVHGGHSLDPELELKGYVCDKCDFETHSLLVFARHVCDDSQIKLAVLKKNIRPERRVVCDKWFQCEQCAFKTKTKNYLKTHILAKHTDPNKVRLFECEQCSYKAKIERYLKKHILAKHANPNNVKWFECEQCSYKSIDKSTLRKHIINRHLNNDEVKWFQCDLCPYKTKTSQILRRHVYNKHTLDKDKTWFRCERCSYKASTKYVIKSHMLRMHQISV